LKHMQENLHKFLAQERVYVTQKTYTFFLCNKKNFASFLCHPQVFQQENLHLCQVPKGDFAVEYVGRVFIVICCLVKRALSTDGRQSYATLLFLPAEVDDASSSETCRCTEDRMYCGDLISL